MITELVQFTAAAPSNIKAGASEPKQGLHILVDFDADGNCAVIQQECFNRKKQKVFSNYLLERSIIQEHVWMIDTNKCFDLPAKGIHSASPYCVAFKRESWIGGSKYAVSNSPLPGIRLDSYFAKGFDEKFLLSENQKQKAIQFSNFIKSDLNSVLNSIPEYSTLDEGDYVIIYNNTAMQEIEQFSALYQQDKLFNTAEYNVTDVDTVYGTSNFYNGYNSKKPFLMHQTASFDIGGRVSAIDAQRLAEFTKLALKKTFPNPLPIFIDNDELTNKGITIYQRDENVKTSHRAIIQELYKAKESLGNYYLLYFSGGEIKDFDFVSKFDYYLNNGDEGWKIENLFELKQGSNLIPEIRLYSVFDFEYHVVTQLFNNSFVKREKDTDSLILKYFDDIDAKYYRATTYSLAITYKKTVYDFIYKSMRQSISAIQFYNISIASIMDDLRQNKDYAIKLKLNILYSLYQNFSHDKSNLNPNIMPSKVEELKNRIQKITENENEHFANDEEYAFGTGQLVYYLFAQSEAGERTHALLEPILQKTSQIHLNSSIRNVFNKYKHNIRFEFKAFSRLSSEVLGYSLEGSLKDLEATILCGYFSPNILFKKKEQTNN